jgi:hypothetical protein
MHIDALYPSRFPRCADLNGQPLRVTVADIKREDIGGESKVVLSFMNGTKALVLNKTNGKAIAKALGNETGAWRGRAISSSAQVDFQGDTVDAIRSVLHQRKRRPTPRRLHAVGQSRPPGCGWLPVLSGLSDRENSNASEQRAPPSDRLRRPCSTAGGSHGYVPDAELGHMEMAARRQKMDQAAVPL